MPPQMWAFVSSLGAMACAVLLLVRGEPGWALLSLVFAVVAGAAARLLSRRSPAPMPFWIRWVLFPPRTFQSGARLRAILRPRAGEHLLEVGPGVGIHALPIAQALLPDGILEVIDVQASMLDDLMRRARPAGISNIRTRVGDARDLPYTDRSFDGAYLISVLGEIPDGAAALRELHRVIVPDGRLVVSEIIADPDFISVRSLKEQVSKAGFKFEQQLGPAAAYLASFRRVAP